MNRKIISWKEVNPLIGHKYYEGYLNSIHIFTIHRLAAYPDMCNVRTKLPGMRMTNMGGNYAEDCKDLCEGALDEWLHDAGLSKVIIMEDSSE